MVNQSTPKKDGFRMPGEFEEHERCFMLWPERGDVWHHEATFAQKAFAEIANNIVNYEPIVVGVTKDQDPAALQLLDPRVQILHIPHDDAWARDSGPTFVKNDQGELRGIDWKFNAWGGLEEGAYSPWDQDDLVASKMIEFAKAKRYRTDDFILEGGSIHVDGEGTLMSTKECLLNKNRNPHLSQDEIENYLREYLNVEKIIWLENGLFNDETDGHVDNICCFARPGEVILSWTDDENSPNYEICRKAYEAITAEKDAKGRTIQVHKLLLPKPIIITEEEYSGIVERDTTRRSRVGDPLPASYVNFLICNKAIILPVFHDPMDQAAIDTIAAIFPERKVVPIYSREIILGGGNVHCITQQQPKA